ncbi:MAG TPA: heme exporter protein CcmD [Candidatus Megaira endosymbiont of Nemacystus decipiens]|nr:heme exporter protein CcmD [Candidatus Megaera endosymbiont of Nemacystus decipiens]
MNFYVLSAYIVTFASLVVMIISSYIKYKKSSAAAKKK